MKIKDNTAKWKPVFLKIMGNLRNWEQKISDEELLNFYTYAPQSKIETIHKMGIKRTTDNRN